MTDSESGAQGNNDLHEEVLRYDPSCRDVAGCCNKRCCAIFGGSIITSLLFAIPATIFVALTKEALPFWLRQIVTALLGNIAPYVLFYIFESLWGKTTPKSTAFINFQCIWSFYWYYSWRGRFMVYESNSCSTYIWTYQWLEYNWYHWYVWTFWGPFLESLHEF